MRWFAERVVLTMPGVLVICTIALASGAEVDKKWTYDAGIGFEGQAAIENDTVRLEVECGNGGGPSIALSSEIKLSLGEMPIIIFKIDGKNHDVAFQCFADGKKCGSFGFPSRDVMTALRRGNQLEIIDVGSFSLKGSNAALSGLSYCLDPA